MAKKKQVKPKKETTIDDLAHMVAKGFEDMGERITSLEKDTKKRFDKVETRLSAVEENLKGTRQDVLNIGDRFVPRYEFDNLLIRVSRLEQKGTKSKRK